MKNKENAKKQDNREKPPVEYICEAFSIRYPVKVQPVEGGLIHKTFKLSTQKDEYCLQGLHPKLCSEEMLRDYEVITRHLEKKAFPAPVLIKTVSGECAAEADGIKWRLTTWLEGESRNRVDTAEAAWNGAELLGRFHLLASDLDYEFESSHPLHDTVFHMKSLEAALARKSKEHFKEISPADTFDFARIEKPAGEALGRLAVLEKSFQSDLLPRRVVHGDPKISNVLFEHGRDIASGLVDLDTCSHHTVLVDLGDAVRSWTPAGPEEKSGRFRMEILEALLAGYLASGFTLTVEEMERIPYAGPLITWELCTRFLRDAVEDSYFGWDQLRYPSRRAHNMARAESMAALARQMETSMKEVENAVKNANNRTGRN